MNDLLQMILSCGNPQAMAINMLKEKSTNNPMMMNLLSLAEKGDSNAIEAIARNMCASQGRDFDKEFNNFKQSLGIKDK